MPNLFNDSASLTYRYDAVSGAELMVPPPIVGKSRLRPSLAMASSLLMSGRLPTELDKYMPSFSEAAKHWGLNMNFMKGIDLSTEGVGGKINVLPNGATQFINYEEATPERRRVFPVSTTKTISSNTITFSVSANDIYTFRKETLLLNWTKSADNYAIVTDVNYTTNAVSIIAAAGTTAFSAVTDFFVSTTSTTDEIERVGTAIDLFSPSSYITDLGLRPFRSVGASGIKVYNTQLFEQPFGYEVFHDGPYKSEAGDRPRRRKVKEDAIFELMEQIESALFWGKEILPTANSNRSAFNGLYRSIVTNTSTVNGGALSFDDIDNVLIDQLGGTHSSNVLYGFCSFKTLTIVEQLFNALSRVPGSGCKCYTEWSGVYQAPINIVSYRTKVIYLIPVANLSIPTYNDRKFGNPTTVNAYGTKLFFIDPAAVMPVIGTHAERGPLFFDIEENIQNPEQSFYGKKGMVRSYLGFALKHQVTSAIINGITSVDLQG